MNIWDRWLNWTHRLGHGVRAQQQQVMSMGAILLCLNALVFNALPNPGFDGYLLYAVASAFVLALGLVRYERLYDWVVNFCMLILLAMLAHFATQTGYIQSSALVWMSILSIPALFFLGQLGGLLWLLVILAIVTGIYVLTLHHQPDPITTNIASVLFATANHVMAASSLMLMVRLYDQITEKQRNETEARNQELIQVHADMRVAQAHKDEFVAAMGHELRTPMNAILGLNGLLQDEFAHDPEGLATVGHIRRSTEHLLQVVNDILDFSQLQSGQMVFFPSACELRPMLTEALTPLRQKAFDKGLTWQLTWAPEVPVAVWVDGPRLCQVMRHLVDNAVKFTAQGSVEIHVAWLNQHLQVEVKDSGRGIALQRQAHIFNRFESADLQTTKDFGGTGLGLSLCERLVVLQGGQIGVHSQPGEGAVFWLEWPATTPQAAAIAPPTFLPDNAVFDVLVVDDNAMNLMLTPVQIHAVWPQARVSTASSAAQALALLQAQHFDLAFVDMVMPDMDGLALTRALRQLPAPWCHVPVVALTANTNPVDEQQALQAGMDMVLHKPINPQALVRTVSQALALAPHP